VLPPLTPTLNQLFAGSIKKIGNRLSLNSGGEQEEDCRSSRRHLSAIYSPIARRTTHFQHTH